MLLKKFDSMESYEKFYENRDHKNEVFDYVHGNGIHNIDSIVKAKTARAAKDKLVKAVNACGLEIGYDDDILNDLSREGRDIMKIEVEDLGDGLFYVNYIVSDFWA